MGGACVCTTFPKHALAPALRLVMRLGNPALDSPKWHFRRTLLQGAPRVWCAWTAARGTFHNPPGQEVPQVWRTCQCLLAILPCRSVSEPLSVLSLSSIQTTPCQGHAQFETAGGLTIMAPIYQGLIQVLGRGPFSLCSQERVHRSPWIHHIVSLLGSSLVRAAVMKCGLWGELAPLEAVRR